MMLTKRNTESCYNLDSQRTWISFDKIGGLSGCSSERDQQFGVSNDLRYEDHGPIDLVMIRERACSEYLVGASSS